MRKKQLFIRNLDAGLYLENFLIAAIASVLAMRLILKIAGYPQIAAAGLHIAHLLFGGFLMLVALIMLLSFLDKASQGLAAIVGGVGFGLFIDEIGKFVTSDVNYFFRPAPALIYVTFILIFLVIRTIQGRREPSRQEYLVNALQGLKGAAAYGGVDEDEGSCLLKYLEKSDPDNPLVDTLRDSIIQMTWGLRKPRILSDIRLSLKKSYQAIVRFEAFRYAVVTFFIIDMLVKIIYVFVLVFFMGLGWQQILDTRVVGHFARRLQGLSFIGSAQLVSSFLAGVFSFLGLLRIRRSRLRAFRMFERSILVTILITEVFIFYQKQFSALLGLFFNISVLVALRFMIDQEGSRMDTRPAEEP